MESLSSIGQVNSANPNRSLLTAKKAIMDASAPRASPTRQDKALDVLLAIEGRPQKQLALPDLSGDIIAPSQVSPSLDRTPAAITEGMEEAPGTPAQPSGEGGQQLALAKTDAEKMMVAVETGKTEDGLEFDDRLGQW